MGAQLLYHDLPLERRLELGLRSPAPFFVTGEDNLRISSLNAHSGVVLEVSGRFMTMEGTIVPFVLSHTPNSDRTVATSTQRLGDGWLLNCRVAVTSGNPQMGQTWALIEVVRGFGGAIAVVGTLAGGYISARQPIAWPGARILTTTDGAGAIRTIQGSDPVAGAEVSETVPTNAVWRLLSIHLPFVADVTVTTREVLLVLDNGTDNFSKIVSGRGITASQTATINYSRGGVFVSGAAAVAVAGALPDLRMLGGSRIRTETSGLQAGDNFGVPILHVEEWLVGA